MVMENLYAIMTQFSFIMDFAIKTIIKPFPLLILTQYLNLCTVFVKQ